MAANVLRLLALEAGVGFGQFLMHVRAHVSGVEAGIELRVVQFIVTEGREELVRPIAGQLALVGVAALATRKLLVDHQHVQASQGRQQGNTQQALTQVYAGA
ncbi:hypothetical protein D3C81_999960 [compost metagenome]